MTEWFASGGLGLRRHVGIQEHGSRADDGALPITGTVYSRSSFASSTVRGNVCARLYDGAHLWALLGVFSLDMELQVSASHGVAGSQHRAVLRLLFS